MARKKASYESWKEEPDAASMGAEVMDEVMDEPQSPVADDDDDDNPEVVLAEQETPPGPQLSESTKAEMEAGKRTLEEKIASQEAAKQKK